MFKRKRNRKFYILAAGLALAVTLFGIRMYGTSAKADAIPSGAALVQRGGFEDLVTAQGTLQPTDYVDVGAQISGQIIKLHVALGDEVEKGDLLAEIDPRSYENQLEADQATLANLEAVLAERTANMEQALRDYKRNSTLNKQNAGSLLNAQQSETTYKSAVAQVDAIKAQIRQAKANLENDALDLSYCVIYAPMSGTVVTLPIKEGQTLNNRTQTPDMMRIADLKTMTVQAEVSEADINKIKKGMEVYFTIVGDATRRHYGRVEKILPSSKVENDVVLYDVEFNIANDESLFLPDMNAQIFFIRQKVENALLVSIQVLDKERRESQAAELTILLPDGKEEKRTVELGARTRTLVEVKSGLAEGERVKLAQSAAGPATGSGRPTGMPRMF